MVREGSVSRRHPWASTPFFLTHPPSKTLLPSQSLSLDFSLFVSHNFPSHVTPLFTLPLFMCCGLPYVGSNYGGNQVGSNHAQPDHSYHVVCSPSDLSGLLGHDHNLRALPPVLVLVLSSPGVPQQKCVPLQHGCILNFSGKVKTYIQLVSTP